jgi:2-dehydropantoate 2-reductase
MGACLAHCGGTVSFVVRRESVAQYPKQLQLESGLGNFKVDVEWVTAVPPATEVLWITVKATQLEAALASLGDVGRAAIVPLLNGVDHVASLRSRYGSERVIAATIAVESERVAPGHIVHRSPFARLNVSSRGRALLESTLEQLAKLAFTCNFVDDEATLLWSKLVFLAPVALATTAHAKATSDIRANPEQWSELQAAVREACEVARLERATVDADATIAFITNLPAGTRSSMQKDVAQGKPPELDAIGGAVVRAAKRHGMEVPVAASLIDAIRKRIER